MQSCCKTIAMEEHGGDDHDGQQTRRALDACMQGGTQSLDDLASSFLMISKEELQLPPRAADATAATAARPKQPPVSRERLTQMVPDASAVRRRKHREQAP